jgi:chromate transporter
MTEPGLPAAARAETPAVGLSELALVFLRIALVSVGGGMSIWALRILVEEKRWFTSEEFLGAVTVCRIMPGPNVVNLAVYVGTRFHGFRGALAAMLGLTVVPLGIVLALGLLYFRYRHIPALESTMTGLVAGAAGMTVSMGLKLAMGYWRQPVAIALAALAFVGIGFLRWPLLVVLVVLAPVGIAWYWPRTGAPPAAET